MEFQIFDENEIAPLYRVYPRQHTPQPAYIQIDVETDEVSADYSGEIGNAVPARVRNLISRRYKIPSAVSGAALVQLFNDENFQKLCTQIVENTEIVWDGSNHVGQSGEVAERAELDLELLLDNLECDGVWEASNWIENSKLGDIWPEGITLEAACDALIEEARSQKTRITGDISGAILEFCTKPKILENRLDDRPDIRKKLIESDLI